jgi:predicted permease
VILPFVLIPIFMSLFKFLKWDKKLSNAMLLPAIFTNAGNYGLPVCLFAFGNQGMDLALVFMVSQTLVVTTLGVYLAASSQMNARKALNQVLRMPAVYAMMAGILVRLTGIQIPDFLGRPIGLLSQAGVPVFLLVLGIQLTGTMKNSEWKPPCLVVFLRLIIAPLVAAMLGRIGGLSGLPWKIFVLEAAMPSPVNATLLAQEFDAKPAQVSMTTMIGTILSVVSLSFWIMILRSF